MPAIVQGDAVPDEILTEATASAVTDTVIAAAMVESQPGQKGPKPEKAGLCSNCHTRLRGRHCHHCGQVADNYHRPVWALFSEILEGYLGLDGRIWRTIPALLFRPGQVTAQYLHGVRQPYMSPFRLFLLSSLLFFLTFAIFFSNSDFANLQNLEAGAGDKGKAIIDASKDSSAQTRGELSPDDAKDLAQVQAGVKTLEQQIKKASAPSRFTLRQKVICNIRDAVLPEDPPSPHCVAVLAEQENQDKEEEDTDSAIQETDDQMLVIPLEKSSETSGGRNTQITLDGNGLQKMFSLPTRRFLAGNVETALNDPGQYRATLSRWAPRLGFLLAPVYGLFLALLFFWRKDLFLYDHMIVALHFHAFLFLFLTLLFPIGRWIGVGYAILIFALWSNYYLYRLMRRVYRAGRFGAVLRVFVLDLVYLIVLNLAFLALLLLGIVFV